jgi:gliding-associated putative ABC transporter substrate-binding component GldG
MTEEIEKNENTEELEQTEEKPLDKRLQDRQKKTESRRQQAVIRIALVVGIIVLINIISIKLFSSLRLDLTLNKIYTLSSASKNIVGKLDDKLVVKAYFTDNLPAPYNNTRRYLQEILEDYRNYSNGNFNYEIISPSDELKLEEDAQKFGIQPVQVQTLKDDRAEAMKAYMGLVFLYAGKQETLPFIGNIGNLEYEITGVIKRLTEAQLKKVGVLGGTDMPGLDKIGKVNQFLSKFYNMTVVDASKNTPIPNDISTLIVFAPKAAQQQQQMMMKQQAPPPTIPENVKFAVDQYIMNGGKVIFLLNKIAISSQQQLQFAQAVNVGVEDMLESYGIKINNNIIKDKDCASVQVPVQTGGFQMYTQIPFPYYPRISNINRNIPAFGTLGQIFLSFTTDLDTAIAGLKGLKVQPILTTSPKTGVDKEFSLVQASGQMLPDTMFKASNLTVGALFTGTFQSFYKGKPVPADTVSGSSPVAASIKEQSPAETKVIVIGNGDFPQDEFRGPEENLMFFANMIDFMTDDVGLSEIRAKDSNPQPLKTIEDSTKKIIKYMLWVLPSFIVLGYGLMRWKKRKAQKEKA